MNEKPPLRLIDVRACTARYGCKTAKWYDDIRKGLMIPPIRIGPRFARWPEHEIDALLKARVAGADDEAVRALVADLWALRRGGRLDA